MVTRSTSKMAKVAEIFIVFLIVFVLNVDAMFFRHLCKWGCYKETSETDPCNDDVIAYYKFDHSYRDVCFGNNAYGDARRGPPNYYFRNGISGEAVNMVRGTLLRIPSLNGYEWGSKFSIGFWFQTRTYGQQYGNLVRNFLTTYRYVANRTDMRAVTVGSWDIFIRKGETKQQSLIGATIVTSRANETWENMTVIQESHWYHFAMTYDGQTINIYINNHLVLSDSECCYGEIVSAKADVMIGGFYGYIDELKLFKKALTSKEVTKLYQLKVV